MVKYVEMELCEASHLILTCSELDKYQYKTIYHIDEGKIEVFPNGVNTCLIQPVRTQDKETFKKNLKLSKKVVIFIGSGYPPNIEAGKFVIDVLAEKCSDVQFLIIGSVGSFLQSDKRNVRICGTITDDEKLSYLSASDIAINPMFHGSGTNIKMFDFFAAGLPTISTPIGARGIIQDQSFIIVDITDFPKKIKEIFENPDLYNCLSMKCRLLVEKNYHWPDISKKLGMRIIDLYLHEGYL
jgi:glycosyltransferase involved in cell wall biosynthesis